MRRTAAAWLAGLAALAGGCGGDPEPPGKRPGVRGALGGSASTRTLAVARLGERPAGTLAWVADEIVLAAGRSVSHAHEPAFAYARRGPSELTLDGRTRRLRQGDGAAVGNGSRHRHSAGPNRSVLWEVRLAAPGAAPPPGARGARRVFESERLRGLQRAPRASFIEVELPPRGGRTTVHTHPGPEFIYQLSGRIDYRNAIIGKKRLGPGGAEAIPPDTAVQKQNPGARPAVFLSWFLVDPTKPFAPKASFEGR